MTSAYDLVVIGSGTAATGVANRARKAGWSVAVVDHRPFGGTCALRGCDPKKMLVGAAEAIDHARRMRGNGVTGDLRIAWPELMAFKRSFTDAVPAQREESFRGKGIGIVHGKARFVSADTVDVGGQRLQGRHVLIATGAEPAPLQIRGAEHLATSDTFLELQSLPARIVFVGGGYIAAELSHIAARAGSRVTVLQHGPRMLKGFDAELVGWLMEKSEAIGIDVRTGTSVQALEKNGDTITVIAAAGGGESRIEADLVVHAAGRIPAIHDLDLDAAGIAAEHGRLKLNAFLQSVSNPRVYAAGDAAQAGPPLTPVSSLDAQVVAANLLEGNHRRSDYRGVPSVAFSIPPIAMVGLTGEQATQQGLRFRTRSANAASWYTAVQAAEPVYGYKVLVDEASDEILGAHLVGPHAEEVINLFALAIRHRIKAGDLKATVFAYPTGASDIGYML